MELYYRRKFRSQTSDNMDRSKSRDGKSQRRGEKRREEKRREEKKEERRKKKKNGQKTEKIRRKKMQARETVDKSRNTVFCQCFVAPEGRKV